MGLTLQLGHRYYIYTGSAGKAIAAFMPEADRKKLLAKTKVYFSRDPSRLNKKRLENEFIECRKLGYAKDIGERRPGINFISSPVFNLQNTIIGCITLIGTFPKIKVEEYGGEVTRIAKQISQKLGADIETIYPK
jgi:DNA-binding IclR family transcriptional regulator